MPEMVGENLRDHLQDPPSLLPVYRLQNSKKNMVEKAFDYMGTWLDCGIPVDLLVYELTGY